MVMRSKTCEEPATIMRTLRCASVRGSGRRKLLVIDAPAVAPWVHFTSSASISKPGWNRPGVSEDQVSSRW